MKIGTTPIQLLDHPLTRSRQIKLYVKREDLNHPTVSGNKLRKLKYNLADAKKQMQQTLLTFGGAFSNHIYATAAAGKLNGFKTIGIIRGEEQLPLNPTLQFAQEQGMQIHYLNRSTYKQKHSQSVITQLKEQFGSFYLIPEGGTNELAIEGCKEILAEDELDFSHYCLAVGTGGTISGIIQRLQGRNQVIGFSALKGNFLEKEVTSWSRQLKLTPYPNWAIEDRYHFGGYAKTSTELMTFIKEIEQMHGLLLDPVYTGKCLFGVLDKIHKNEFPAGSRILFIHTGGLQGRAGFGL